MDLVISDPTYFRDFEGQEEFLQNLRQELSFNFPEHEIELELIDIGHGADAPSILISLGGAWAVFCSGKTIVENIDAWKKIGKSIREFVVSRKALIDAQAAILLSLEEIDDAFFETGNCEVQVISVEGNSPNLRRKFNMEMYPEQIYVVTLKNQENKALLLVLTSRGTLVHKIELPSLLYFELP